MAGDQLPVTLLFEVVGNAGIEAPAQYASRMVNCGVTLGKMVMVMSTEVAH